MKRILSIDGGGMYGLVSLQILKQYVEAYNVNLNSKFDLMVGNSTGAIIVGMIRSGHSIDDIINLYVTQGSQIFNRSNVHKLKTLFGLFGSKYSNKQRQKLLQDQMFVPFGAVLPIMLTSYDILNKEPRFFKNWRDKDKNLFLNDLCFYSSSAPVYFKPVVFQDLISTENPIYKKRILTDGGLVANNPTMCAYAEAKRLWPHDDLEILSIGNINDVSTGKIPKTLLGWARKIPSTFLDGGSDAVDYQLSQILNQDFNLVKYKRFEYNKPMNYLQMDDTSKEAIYILNSFGEAYAKSIVKDLNDFC